MGIDIAGRLRELFVDTTDLIEESAHESFIFPEDTDETSTHTAHANANTFCAWTEIVDNNAVTLSSKFASKDGHISAIVLEECSAADKRYLGEVSYGASNTIVTRFRFMQGVGNLLIVQSLKVNSEYILAGETVYYRLKCETGGSTCVAHFRYHFHNGV